MTSLQTHSTSTHSTAEAAVGGRDDVVPADRLGVPGDAVGDEFGVLDDVDGVADHAGRMTLPSGSLMSRQTFHSCSCRTLAALKEYTPALIASMTSKMSAIGMSVVCGPCQLPQHRWKRIRSAGSPRIV
jgi:hypothetical protein